MKIMRSVFFAVLLALTGSAWAQLVAGTDYSELKPSQPVESGKKIEVLEFFWYGCPHCYHFEPEIKGWLKRKPADVEFHYIPGTFANPAWEPLTRTYYALDSLGVAEKYQNKQKLMVTDVNTIAGWLATQGVNKQKFLDAYNSFTVSTRYQRSVDMTRAFSIEGTPTLAIDGKYLIAPSMDGYYGGRNVDGSPKIDYDRFFRNVNLLILKARKARGGN